MSHTTPQALAPSLSLAWPGLYSSSHPAFFHPCPTGAQTARSWAATGPPSFATPSQGGSTMRRLKHRRRRSQTLPRFLMTRTLGATGVFCGAGRRGLHGTGAADGACTPPARGAPPATPALLTMQHCLPLARLVGRRVDPDYRRRRRLLADAHAFPSNNPVQLVLETQHTNKTTKVGGCVRGVHGRPLAGTWPGALRQRLCFAQPA